MALRSHGSYSFFFLLLDVLKLVVSIYKSQCDKPEPFKLSCYMVLSARISLNKKNLGILAAFQIKLTTTCIFIVST